MGDPYDPIPFLVSLSIIAGTGHITGPNVLPIKVINEPVEGIERENSASVLPSSAIAMTATMMGNGDATPAAEAISAKLK